MGSLHRKPRHLLFMAESITLAHVVRLLVLAEGYRSKGGKVTFATSEKYRPWVEAKDLDFRNIHCLDSRIFQQRLSKGQTFLRRQEISDQVQEDLGLLSELKPDVVVGDFRLSLEISARVARIPYMGVINAYWSHFDPKTMPVPELPLFSLIGRKLSYQLFRHTQSFTVPLILKQQARGFNQVRKKYGLEPLSNVIDSYTQADLLVFPDAPEVIPPPSNFKIPYLYLGPIAGNLPCALPIWWPNLRADLPLVYLNLGSSGRHELNPRIIDALLTLPVQIIVGTAQNLQSQQTLHPGRVFSAEALPGDQVCQRADLVICNGGAPSMYQALIAGTPVIGLTNNMDQRIAMPYFARLPFVKHLRSWEFESTQLIQFATRVLGDKSLKIDAAKFSEILHKYNVSEQFEKAITIALDTKITHDSVLDLC